MSELPATGSVALIADDEEVGALLLADAAAASGLTPHVCGDGAAALDAALALDPAIILLDVEMPVLDGIAVCRRLRAEPRFATTPIVMVTGHEDSGAIRLAFEAGATDFIAKPVNWALLPRRLTYILRNAAAARALAEHATQVRTLVEALPDALWVVAPDGSIEWSPNTDATCDDGPENPIATPARIPGALDAIRETARDGLHRKLEYREEGPSPSRRSYELRFSRREGGDVVVVRRDTSERTAAAERIERLAYFDPMTGLPNRQRCIETAEGEFAEAAAWGDAVAVIYLDLNNFKRVNDSFGHAVGDSVLRTVSGRLERVLGDARSGAPHASVARFGGDEFVILVRHAAARSVAAAIATACCAALKDPIAYESLEFHSAPSIGLAVFPDDGPNVETVLKHADTAMHQAKVAAAPGVVSYSAAMSSRMRDWLELEGRLRRAVERDLLHLAYQPKFRLGDGTVAGVEALLRWCEPEHGDIPPGRFIEIAEDSGLIIDLGAWVIRAACRQLRAWLDRGISIPVAVNVSGKELLHGDPARVIEMEAASAGVPPSLIEVEITESVLVQDSMIVRQALRRMRELGCRIALDDFGTGYSSLAYITRFPPDRIKIDKAFVQDVDRSPSDAAVASAILSLAQSLDVVVTAEGVERGGQLAWLQARGCQEVQGFLLSRPLSPRDLEDRFLTRVAPEPRRESRTGVGLIA